MQFVFLTDSLTKNCKAISSFNEYPRRITKIVDFLFFGMQNPPTIPIKQKLQEIYIKLQFTVLSPSQNKIAMQFLILSRIHEE
jgi:hypothetical protein